MPAVQARYEVSDEYESVDWQTQGVRILWEIVWGQETVAQRTSLDSQEPAVRGEVKKPFTGLILLLHTESCHNTFRFCGMPFANGLPTENLLSPIRAGKPY